jgi:hypothetical protein
MSVVITKDRHHTGVDTSAHSHRIAVPLMLNKSILEDPEVLQESVSVFLQYTTCYQASSSYLVDRLLLRTYQAPIDYRAATY